MAQLKDLIVNGPSRFIGDVYATTFTGNLAGNAASATSASSAGNASTVSGLSVHSGRNNEANKIVRTDGTGHLQVGYINSSDGNENNNSSPDRVWGSRSDDSYLRTYRTSALNVGYATAAGSCTGNSATATTLQTSRTIWGQSFDGSGNIDGALIVNAGDYISDRATLVLNSNANEAADIIFKCNSNTTGSYGWWAISSRHNSTGDLIIYKGSENDAEIGFDSEILTIQANGNVGIGNTDPYYDLDVAGIVNANLLRIPRITLRPMTTGTTTLYDIQNKYNTLQIGKANQTPSFLMTPDGYIYINPPSIAVSPAHPLVVDGVIACATVIQSSDIKYKKNIKQIEYNDAANIIENLNPVIWDWNEKIKTGGSSSGFIAQEVMNIIPNAISADNEGSLSLDYTQLHSYEIKVIQEQQKEIKYLKQKLEVLEKSILQ